MKRISVYFGYIPNRRENVYGQSYKGKVEINLLARTNPLRTFLHEILHLRYPGMPERQIWNMERKIWRKMSTRQRFELGKFLFSRKFKNIGEDE